MPTIGSNSKPAYVYDSGTDTWIPIGPGEHTHDYIGKDVITTTGDIIYASAANTPARRGIGSTGQVLTVSGGLPVWGAAPSPTFYGCALSKSALQSLTNGAYTNITFDVETFDIGGYHDNVTNNTRITIPAGRGGYYLVTYHITTSNGDTSAIGAIYKNGSKYNTTSGFKNILIGNGGVSASAIMSLSAGDYIEVAVYSGASNNVDSAAQNNIPTAFSCTFLGV